MGIRPEPDRPHLIDGTAPPLPRPVLFEQFWADLTFLHWEVDPDAVAPLLPAGTRPDVFPGASEATGEKTGASEATGEKTGDRTFVALVPFVMRSTRQGTRLPLPYVGAFPETNVRLYSVDDAGRHGVVFCSLETARAAVVPLTRLALGVPYTWARMRMTRTGEDVDYRSTRRWPRRGLTSRLRVRVGEPVEPTPLEVWLTARWGAHTRRLGRTWWVPNEHATWPLRAAEIIDLDDQLVGASGAGPVGAMLRPLFSDGVRARFGRPSALD
jgi:uncharacterized protein